MAYRASRGRKQAKKGVQLTIMVVGEYYSCLGEPRCGPPASCEMLRTGLLSAQ